MHTYDYPRPALTVDVVLVAGPLADPYVLLIRRAREPFLGMWALPGGFVEELEPLERAARRELAEETGLAVDGPLNQIGTFGDPGRDPRGWVVTAAFAARLADGDPPMPHPGDDAASAEWHPVRALPPLASDHTQIVAEAMRSLSV